MIAAVSQLILNGLTRRGDVLSKEKSPDGHDAILGAPPPPNCVAPRPYLVALAGPGGSGKSTLAQRVKSHLEGALSRVAVHVLPMDGYHYSRHHLRTRMPDPELAFRRRGAEWTFDAERFARDIATLSTTGHLSAPAFDHQEGDPREGAIEIESATRPSFSPAKDVRHREVGDPTSDGLGATEVEPHSPSVVPFSTVVVIVEGLYVLLGDRPHWRDALEHFDLRLLLAAPLEVTTERLVRRHMAAWNISRDEAVARASGSDAENALLVATVSPQFAHSIVDVSEECTMT